VQQPAVTQLRLGDNPQAMSSGRVTLTAGTDSWEGREGDLLMLPDAPHSLTALADSAVLLTVVKRSLPTPGEPGSAALLPILFKYRFARNRPAPRPHTAVGSGSQPHPFGKIKDVIQNEGAVFFRRHPPSCPGPHRTPRLCDSGSLHGL
jgi:hypothetical protein